MPISRRTFTTGLLAAGIGSAVAPAIARAQVARPKVTFAVAGDGLHYIVHYIAEGGEFFKRENLDVETVAVQSGPRMVAAIMGGSADLAPSNIEGVIRAFQKGGTMVAVARVYDVFPMSLVLSKAAVARTGINRTMPIDEKVQRLSGLKIGITTAGSGTDFAVRSLFRARNLDPDRQVSIQPLGTPESMLAALERGVVDGFSYPAPHVQIAEKRGLGEVVVDPFRGEVPEIAGMPYLSLVTTRDILGKRRPELAAAIRAYGRAMRFAHEKPAEARALVHAKFRDMDRDVFDAAFETYLVGVPKTTAISPEQVMRTVNWMNLREPAPLSVTFADVVDTGLAAEVDRQLAT